MVKYYAVIDPKQPITWGNSIDMSETRKTGMHVKDKTNWQIAAEAQGTTDSERALSKLARKTFLSLWSFTNVYTDEGQSGGKGDGKELVDLLVVFGNNVLLFSDKHCAFPTDKETNDAWQRWYKRAIEKSAKQLSGAEKFLRSFPDRVYVDKLCQTKLPITIPRGDSAKYFLIAVTRGGNNATAEHFGGGSTGSLMLDNKLDNWRGIRFDKVLKKQTSINPPFVVGFPLKNRRFVHILDEITVEILLGELDTVPDLVDYLACKERFMTGNKRIIVAGEEDLLTEYMCTQVKGRHALPSVPPDFDGLCIEEGGWQHYESSYERARKRQEDEKSYLWDNMIEYQASFVRAGTTVGLPHISPETIDHELILRSLAAENRLARRALAQQLTFTFSKNEVGKKFARIAISGSEATRAYVFLSFPKEPGIEYQTYRAMRQAALLAYCHGIKIRFPEVAQVVGIASEPFVMEVRTQDYLYLYLEGEVDPIDASFWQRSMDELGILQTPNEHLQAFWQESVEFPIPFRFSD